MFNVPLVNRKTAIFEIIQVINDESFWLKNSKLAVQCPVVRPASVMATVEYRILSTRQCFET